MKKQLLSLRVSRRAIGAVVLGGDGVSSADGRHLRSNTQQAVSAAIRMAARTTELALDRHLRRVEEYLPAPRGAAISSCTRRRNPATILRPPGLSRTSTPTQPEP